ncbi:hypothetical protein Ancab_020400 [Ancistrocladus abbreviatus]
MQVKEARQLLGFLPNSRPTPAQVKRAFRKMVWDFHPDRFPINEKAYAESKFKLISEAYTCLLSGGGESSTSVAYARVVRTGVPAAHRERKICALIGMPFLLIIFGAVGLGGLCAARAYRKQKEAYPSHNPFLP